MREGGKEGGREGEREGRREGKRTSLVSEGNEVPREEGEEERGMGDQQGVGGGEREGGGARRRRADLNLLTAITTKPRRMAKRKSPMLKNSSCRCRLVFVLPRSLGKEERREGEWEGGKEGGGIRSVYLQAPPREGAREGGREGRTPCYGQSFLALFPCLWL